NRLGVQTRRGQIAPDVLDGDFVLMQIERGHRTSWDSVRGVDAWTVATERPIAAGMPLSRYRERRKPHRLLPNCRSQPSPRHLRVSASHVVWCSRMSAIASSAELTHLGIAMSSGLASGGCDARRCVFAQSTRPVHILPTRISGASWTCFTCRS